MEEDEFGYTEYDRLKLRYFTLKNVALDVIADLLFSNDEYETYKNKYEAKQHALMLLKEKVKNV